MNARAAAIACPDCGHDISWHIADEIDDEGMTHGRGCIAVDRIGKPPRKPAFDAGPRAIENYRRASKATRRSCCCWRSPEAICEPERFALKLKPGDRIRSKVDETLTGHVKHFEYHERGWLSPIPYCIEWDDSARAAEVLGWLFVYASDHGVEAIPVIEQVS